MSKEQNIDLELFRESIKKSDSYSELCRFMNWPIGGTTNRLILSIIQENNFDISHFTRSKHRVIKYQKIIKICPVCNKEFFVRSGEPREKVVCSHSCSNSFFRSGINNPNWKSSAYRSTCFFSHEKKCIICGEQKIVSVHHFDENKKNNLPENLIPLCPTHHQYVHSRFSFEIMDKIEEYRKQFMTSNSAQDDQS